VKTLKKIVLVILILPILLLLASFLLPSKYRVERSVVIKATPEAIYPWLADLRKWPDWTVWNTTTDPTLAYAYSGPAEGAGAEMSWTAKSGSGSLKLTSAEAQTGVKYDLNFDNGKHLSTGGVTMAPAGDGATRVTFSNEGGFGANPVMRYLGLMMNKFMGGEFDKNLEGLRKKVEPKKN